MKRTRVFKGETVDWSEPPLQRWLGGITRSGTRRVYKSAFRIYHNWTGMNAIQLIDEAIEDAKRDPREKKDVVLHRLINFYNYLKTEHPVRSRGKGAHEVTRKGLSDKLAHLYVSAIRSFYATFGITVRLKGRHALPKPRVRNKRMIVGAEQVKLLVDNARTPRDRSIILTIFQSGMDVSTLCSLKYGDVAEGLAKNEYPLKLDLYRPKTGVEYYTFLGRDAIEALKAYIKDMESRGVRFTHDTPLYLKERGKSELTPNLVQNMFREVAVKSGLVDESLNGKAFNPLSPHALRESFGSIMTNSGVPDTIVDFWLGHEIGDLAKAYKGVQYESLRRMYLEREPLLSISKQRLDEREIEVKVNKKVDERVKALRSLIDSYAAENLELKARLARLELENTRLQKKIAKIEELIERFAKRFNLDS